MVPRNSSSCSNMWHPVLAVTAKFWVVPWSCDHTMRHAILTPWYRIIIRTWQEFLLIRPTRTNLDLYESWINSPTQSQVFFGDLADVCYRYVRLRASPKLEESTSRSFTKKWAVRLRLSPTLIFASCVWHFDRFCCTHYICTIAVDISAVYGMY